MDSHDHAGEVPRSFDSDEAEQVAQDWLSSRLSDKDEKFLASRLLAAVKWGRGLETGLMQVKERFQEAIEVAEGWQARAEKAKADVVRANEENEALRRMAWGTESNLETEKQLARAKELLRRVVNYDCDIYTFLEEEK